MKQFWLMGKLKRLGYYAVFMAFSSAAMIGLLAPTQTAHAGMPNSCPVPGHGGPPCNMEKCAGMKDGKPSGNNCSKYCAKSCCLCSDTCPKEHNQNQGGDEEYIAYQFGD